MKLFNKLFTIVICLGLVLFLCNVFQFEGILRIIVLIIGGIFTWKMAFGGNNKNKPNQQ